MPETNRADAARSRLSASAAWDATSAFMKRHSGMVFALALAFSALPPIIAFAFLGETLVPPAGAAMTPEQMTRLLPANLLFLLIGLVGSLSIFTLVLRPGTSVGEAIGRALRRLPAAIGQLILLALLGSLLALPIVLFAGLGVLGVESGGPAPNPALLLLPLLLLPVIVYLLIRLFLGQVAVADGAGPVDGLRRSWELTAGNAGRLFGFLLVVGLLFLVVYFALTFVVGALAQIVGGAIGGEGTGTFLALVVGAIISALLSAVLSVLYAQIYRQLSGPDYAQTFA